MVLPYTKMNLPQIYMCSPSRTLLRPPSPYHPSGSSQCTSPKHPVSCIKSGLATRFIYDIIHISMPFSQIIPPSPSPTESKRLFSTSVSLLLSRIQGYCYHLSKFHIYTLVYCIGVFLSLCIIGSSFIYLFLLINLSWLTPGGPGRRAGRRMGRGSEEVNRRQRGAPVAPSLPGQSEAVMSTQPPPAGDWGSQCTRKGVLC